MCGPDNRHDNNVMIILIIWDLLTLIFDRLHSKVCLFIYLHLVTYCLWRYLFYTCTNFEMYNLMWPAFLCEVTIHFLSQHADFDHDY